MVSFLALYRGKSLERAELVAVSTQSTLVAHGAGALLAEQKGRPSAAEGDLALNALTGGRRHALQIIEEENN